MLNNTITNDRSKDTSDERLSFADAEDVVELDELGREVGRMFDSLFDKA